MLFYIIALILLFFSELIYFRIATYFNIVDKPNQRSSHTQITIRGGGIIFYLSILIYFITSGFIYPWFFLGITLVSLISFTDDIHPLPQFTRLIFHFTAIALLLYQLDILNISIWWIIIALIFCTGIINAYNFMDGINGITGGYSLVVVASLWYVNHYLIPFIDNRLLLLTLAGILIFCLFNFRKKAKCFAGDVGSVSMAFILLFILGKLIIQTQNFSWIVFLAVYGIDSILTIIHRFYLKEKITEPHRKHLYQILANELKVPHYIVSTLYMILQLVINIGYLMVYPKGYLYLILTIIILAIGYIIFMRKFFHLHAKNNSSRYLKILPSNGKQ